VSLAITFKTYMTHQLPEFAYRYLLSLAAICIEDILASFYIKKPKNKYIVEHFANCPLFIPSQFESQC